LIKLRAVVERSTICRPLGEDIVEGIAASWGGVGSGVAVSVGAGVVVGSRIGLAVGEGGESVGDSVVVAAGVAQAALKIIVNNKSPRVR
jgi:hypothetical protein